ncbi:MAG: DoxX family protein [Bacteroidetes bacterium]|nr:DoxX family protein [Bacteroidota bacterium]MCA6445067.1 DoxX family protein [Bacteroidota bacterium]
MKNKSYIILKVLFSSFMLFSAIGELTLNETVVHSMEIIQMPVYLLYLLGILKISGIIALWFSPFKWIKEWAYAGFTFDFIGAIFGFIATGNPMIPDIIMAPVGLMLCLATYYLWKKNK